jgi:hypothetical protein
MRFLLAIFSACLAAQAQIPAQDARNVALPGEFSDGLRNPETGHLPSFGVS